MTPKFHLHDFPQLAAQDGVTFFGNGETYVSNHAAVDTLLREWGQPPVSALAVPKDKMTFNVARASESPERYILLIVFTNHPRPEDNGYSLFAWDKSAFTREQAELRAFEKLTRAKMNPGRTVFFPPK